MRFHLLRINLKLGDSQMLNLAWAILFLLIGIGGLILIPLGIPGTFIVVGSAAGFGAITGWDEISLLVVGILLGLAIGGEILDFGLGMVGANQKGSSKWGMIGAFVGGITGAFLGIPVPIIGNFLGVFVGAFFGAFILELIWTGDPIQALRVGEGSFVARIFSSLVKISLGVGMLAFYAFRVFAG